MMNDLPQPNVPVFVETPSRPVFSMVRCHYMSVECDEPGPDWGLGIGGDPRAAHRAKLASLLCGRGPEDEAVRWDLQHDFSKMIAAAQSAIDGGPRFLVLLNRGRLSKEEAQRRIASGILQLPKLQLRRREMLFLRLMMRMSVPCRNYRERIYILWEAVGIDVGACDSEGEDFLGPSYELATTHAGVNVDTVRPALERMLARLETSSRSDLLDIVEPDVKRTGTEEFWATSMYEELGRGRVRRGFGLAEGGEYTAQDVQRELDTVLSNIRSRSETAVAAEVVTCALILCECWEGGEGESRILQPAPATRPLTSGCKGCGTVGAMMTYDGGAMYCDPCHQLRNLRS